MLTGRATDGCPLPRTASAAAALVKGTKGVSYSPHQRSERLRTDQDHQVHRQAAGPQRLRQRHLRGHGKSRERGDPRHTGQQQQHDGDAERKHRPPQANPRQRQARRGPTARWRTTIALSRDIRSAPITAPDADGAQNRPITDGAQVKLLGGHDRQQRPQRRRRKREQRSAQQNSAHVRAMACVPDTGEDRLAERLTLGYRR